MEENNTNKSSNLLNIISSNGNNKEFWVELLSDIYSGETNNNDDIILSLKDFLTKKSNVEICLDIIHFLVDYGTPIIVEQIAKKDFLQIILGLLKKSSESSVEVQKKVIFLTKIWAKKYENENNQNYLTFIDNYNTLKKQGIIFPPDNYKLQTYTKYISKEEANNAIMKAKNMKENNNNENEFANPFLSDMGELNNIVNEEIFGDKKMNNEDKENPHKLNNNFNIENNNFNSNYNINNNNNQNNNNNNFNKNDNNINNDFNNNNNRNFNNNNNNNNIQNKTNINENDNDNFPFENSNNNEVNQKNKMDEQKTRYPVLPNQFEGNNNMNRNNNNFNNNYNQNNNNQFSNNNIRRNNTHDNMNNNTNYNFNQNSNYNNRGNNNYSNQNYNNNINNNFNKNNNNNNYNNSSNSNYNNRPNNYNNNNYNDTFDIISFKQTLGNKLLQLNAWIDNGKFSFQSGNLKQGIIEIINEIPKCEYLMNRCQLNNDRRGYEVARNMKMDMEQTCFRYENLMNDRRVEQFRSSFTGNSRQYYFDKSALLGNTPNNNFRMNDFNEYYKNKPNFDVPSTTISSNYEKEPTIGDRLNDYGGKVKDGLFFVGGKIKDTAVSGFNFVRDKFNDDGKDNNSNDYL